MTAASGADRCRTIHPALPLTNDCREPAGHDGPHMAHDSHGRPEYVWTDDNGWDWAPDPASGADQPTLRDQLAEVLDDTAFGLYMGRNGPGWGATIADALLPVIEADRERAKAEGGAEALEAAGRDLYRLAVVDVPDWLHDRAAALRGKT